MGYYIQTSSNKGKAEIIIEKYGAKRVPRPWKFNDIPEDQALLVVIDNGPFEAVGYCYNEREFLDFSDPTDDRPRAWLTMDKKLAEKLSGYSKKA